MGVLESLLEDARSEMDLVVAIAPGFRREHRNC